MEQSYAEYLQKVKGIRTRENIQLKPSPFLRSTYVDQYGDERPVEVRNYQKQIILNMLMTPRMINGEDTGLGKTLEMLTTIGYIWMKEPEYVPIVLTKKSALFQWGEETDRFMQGMEVVTVYDDPLSRHKMYSEFFLNHNQDKKRLIIMTYDTVLRDLKESVVRDKTYKGTKEEKRALKDAKKRWTLVKQRCDEYGPNFNARFQNRIFDVEQYISARIADPPQFPPEPPTWTPDDSVCLDTMLRLRDDFREARSQLERSKDIVEPPVVVRGLLWHINQMKEIFPTSKFALVMDEMHVLKNHRGKIHESVADIAKVCDRVYGMTATPVQNRLMEFFSLFRIIEPQLFPKITHFHNDFCHIKMQSISRSSNRQVPIVVGYKNLDEFVRRIEPYYLSRRKYDVAKELPQLVTRELRCELYDKQEELYDLAENGLLSVGDNPDAESAEMLKAMTFIQQAADSPYLIKDEETGERFEGPSVKIDVLIDLLENELDGLKVIVFSKFEQMVTLIEQALKEKKIKCTRITGAENSAAQRDKAKKSFQDPKSGVNVILITMAGSESINLQAAEHFVFVDSPWSWGAYAQLIGRMIRIGSQYIMVVATHLVAVKQNGSKTIDQYVIKTLKSKKLLADKVAGESIKDGLEFVQTNDTMDLFHQIRDGVLNKDDAAQAVKSQLSTTKKARARAKSEKTPVIIEPGSDTPLVRIPNVSFDDL